MNRVVGYGLCLLFKVNKLGRNLIALMTSFEVFLLFSANLWPEDIGYWVIMAYLSLVYLMIVSDLKTTIIVIVNRLEVQ